MTNNMSTKEQLPIVAFRSGDEWKTWLMEHGETSEGAFLQIFKKDSGVSSISYAEALDVALCFGWIDGQKKSLDDKSWLQRFTPRRAKSIWSKRNIEHVERLTSLGQMNARGLREVEAARADGRFNAAYDAPSQMAAPEDFMSALAHDKKAEAFFKTLNKANLYAIAWRLQTAKKPETRAARIEKFVEMLHREEKFH